MIIVAGGTGSRMKSDVPKQFMLLCGEPVLMHTMKLFYNYDPDIHQILVLNSLLTETWKKLCAEFGFKLKHVVAEGGPERYHSVKNGLRYVENRDALVAVHDAVRPLVSPEVISLVMKEAAVYGNAIPVVPVSESLRIKEGAMNKAADRKKFFIVQTPQCFRADVLHNAYRQNYDELFTDDAIVVEAAGERIRLVEGNAENIKITAANDLIIAEALLSHRLQ